ncbi:MAG: hypothetical protein BWY83_02671 [bacterium ADurb.Bin478]|nr:MAG: hypothetical protein BWY83_02671 [bacterium ADurb.Bin478]
MRPGGDLLRQGVLFSGLAAVEQRRRVFQPVQMVAEILKRGEQQVALARPGRIRGAGDDVGDLFERQAQAVAGLLNASQP